MLKTDMMDACTIDNDGSKTDVFIELYEKYLPKVFRYINYRVGDTDLAEDLTSTVFEKALVGFNSYQPEKAMFSTWLLSIAGHVVIDHYRKTSGRQTISLDEINEMASENIPPDEEAVRKDEQRRLQACLASLSKQEQEIIALKFGAELTNRQMAGMLSLSESNVGTILYRAVRKLRDSFGRM